MSDRTTRVTPREAEVLAALAERLTNSEIAGQLYLSERTVESHVSSLLRKLGATSRLELAEIARRQEPAGSTRAPLPPTVELLTDPDSFCGREPERAELRTLWERATGGVLLMTVVAGEAGIGKSRLVAEAAAEAHANGAQVWIGTNLEDAGRPYEPFVQAITADATSIDDVELRRRVGTHAEALARVIPELGERLGVPADSVVFDPISARTDAYAALHRYLCAAAERAPILLVVEDAHWAAPATLSALRYVATIGGRVPVLVVVTTRDVAPDVGPGLEAFLGEIARVPTVTKVALRGLGATEVASLLRVLGADADPTTTAEETGGNPLFVRELAAATQGGSLAALLRQRNALLTDDASASVDLAAVIGSTFDADLVAAAAATPIAEVLTHLEAGEAAGLVLRARGREGLFAFTHALFRAARYDAMAPSRRLQLHAAVATALARRSDDDRVAPELARHACLAASLGGARDAIAFATRAASLAEAALAFDEAALHYQRALDVAERLDPPDALTRLRLSIRLGEVMQGAGQPGYEPILTGAAQAARELGDTQALAEVGWAMVKYGGPRHPSRDAQFVAIAQEALHELGPEPTAARARTLAAASEDLCFTDPTQASVLVHEALAIARRLDDPLLLGHVLLSYRVSACTPGNAHALHPAADELIDIGRRTGQPTFTMLGLYHRAYCFRSEGNLAESDAAIAAAVASKGERALPPTYAAAVTLFRSTQQLLAGELDPAEAIANEVWALASDGFDPTNWYGPAVLLVRHAQDRLVELLPLLEPAVTQPGIGEIYRAALSVALAHAGRTDEAAALLRALAVGGFSGVPRNFGWLASMLALAETTELVGDTDAASQLLEMLGPYPGLLGDLPQTVVGTVDLALAQVALTARAASMAEAAAARAVDASRRRGTPIFLGRELVRLAAARRLSGARDDDVAPLMEEAFAIADRLGAALIRREAQFYGL